METPIYLLPLIFFIITSTKGQGGSYCQPGESCWPTSDEIEAFSSKLSATDARYFVIIIVIVITFVLITSLSPPRSAAWASPPSPTPAMRGSR